MWKIFQEKRKITKHMQQKLFFDPIQRFQHLFQNPKVHQSAMGFSNHAQRHTTTYYLDVDSPFEVQCEEAFLVPYLLVNKRCGRGGKGERVVLKTMIVFMTIVLHPEGSATPHLACLLVDSGLWSRALLTSKLNAVCN